MSKINFLSEDLNIVQNEVQRIYGNQVGVPDPITFNKTTTTNLVLASNKIGFLKSFLIVGTGSIDIDNKDSSPYTLNFTGHLELKNLWIYSLFNIVGSTYITGFGWIITYIP